MKNDVKLGYRSPPKAEATGSNPVGCAIISNTCDAENAGLKGLVVSNVSVTRQSGCGSGPPDLQEKALETGGNRIEGETIGLAANGLAQDNLAYWQSQFVIRAMGVRPELASMLAALIFGRAGQ